MLFAGDPQKLRTMVQEVHDVSLSVGLEMNLSKIKLMTDTENTAENTINTAPLGRVIKYIYHGQEVKLGTDNLET